MGADFVPMQLCRDPRHVPSKAGCGPGSPCRKPVYEAKAAGHPCSCNCRCQYPLPPNEDTTK